MEDAWVKALPSKDQTAVGNMIADDFAGLNPEGKHVTKSQLLDEIKNEPDALSSATNDNMDVHVYRPNLATVTGTTTEKGKDKHGKEFTRSYVWVDTWMERNGKWECIAEGVDRVAQKEVRSGDASRRYKSLARNGCPVCHCQCRQHDFYRE